MERYEQLVMPTLYIEDHEGYSLRHIQNCFDAPGTFFTAWDAWKATQFKHKGDFPDAYVPVWFESTIPGYPGILGHVMIWDPLSQKLFGTPRHGYGRNWYALGEIVNSTTQLAGWSEDINDVLVVRPLNDV